MYRLYTCNVSLLHVDHQTVMVVVVLVCIFVIICMSFVVCISIIAGVRCYMSSKLDRPDNLMHLDEKAIDTSLPNHPPELLNEIGQGRYATVHKVRYHGEIVAAKIFKRRDAWEKERDIYETPLLKHENILCFIRAEEVVDIQGVHSYCLYFNYHPQGSLYSYLQTNNLTIEQFCRFSRSVAAGLAFLHSEILEGGILKKPAIAHRDLKSKNILVKSDLTCCINDYGLAIKFSNRGDPIEAQGQVHKVHVHSTMISY